jgi:hypothetical protein
MNKYNFWGIVTAIALFLTVFGMWAKITHQAYAERMLTIGMWTLAVSLGVYGYLKFMALKSKK